CSRGRLIARLRVRWLSVRWLSIRWRWLISRLRCVGVGLLARACAACRIKLDRVDVFHINGNAAFAPARATAHKDRELLVFETDDLTTNHAAVFQTYSVGERGQSQAQSQRNDR